MTYNNNNNNNNNNTSTSISTSTSQTVVNSAEKRKHVAKTTSTIPEDKDMTSPDHRKQRQTSALEYNTQQPIALNFEQIREDINMDTGGNDDELSVNNSMCTVETPTVVVESEEEISITDFVFTNNMEMDITDNTTVPTTITATDLSNGDFTPVRNGSPNRQATQERRNTTTNNNNSYSALQTTSTTKESNNNNNNNTTNSSAKDRQDHNNE
jgi:hypothetical protein